VIPEGNGLPDQLAISPGADGVIDSTLNTTSDDVQTGTVVTVTGLKDVAGNLISSGGNEYLQTGYAD